MDVTGFLQSHIPQITATTLLVTYSHLRRKLTPPGIAAGILVAIIHMLHPWPAFFWLLIVFFFLGTVVTKMGHEAKQHLTTSSTGSPGGEGARTSAQVFANSGTASVLILVHAYLLSSTPFISSTLPISAGIHAPVLQGLLPVGIIAQYAAVAADTFSSELGILASSEPFLITAPWKRVPKGTNGGVTVDGLAYGALGGFLLTVVAILALFFLPPPGVAVDGRMAALLTFAGLGGSVIDSLLGAVVQSTVTEKKGGKVVEGPGGRRVKVVEGGSRVVMGRDWLTNNGVNFAMASITSGLAMSAAWGLGLGIGYR